MSITQLQKLTTVMYNLESINQSIKNLSEENQNKTMLSILNIIEDTKEVINHV